MRFLTSLTALAILLVVAAKIVDLFSTTEPQNYCSLPNSFCALAQQADLANVSRGRDQEAALLVELFKNYKNEKTRPDAQGDPVTIRVTLGIEGIPKISDTTGEFKIDLLVRQRWTDEDLKYNFTPRLGYIVLPPDYEGKLWLPDTEFGSIHNVVVEDDAIKKVMIRISPNGDVLYSRGLSVTTKCPMDLRKYPLDSQVCTLVLGSYRFTDKDILYDWKSSATAIEFSIDSLRLLNNFRLVAHRQRNKVVNYSTGNFSQVACDFYIRRSLGTYLIQFYFPMILFAVISWFPLFTTTSSGTDRITMGLTLLLALTTTVLASNTSSTGVSYITGIHTFGGASFLCVFASLLHSTIFTFLSHGDQNEQAGEQKVGRSSRLRRKLDIFGRIAFPVGYVMFNFVYWNHYYTGDVQPPSDAELEQSAWKYEMVLSNKRF